MGLINISSIPLEETMRIDAEYLLHQDKIKNPVSFTKYFEVIDLQEIALPKKPFWYCEIGNANRYGQLAPIKVDLNIEPTENETSRIHKKIKEEKDIILPEAGSILLSKTRIYLGKMVLVDSKDIYFTKAFYQVKPLPSICQDKKLRQAMGYVLLQGVLRDSLISISRYGKSYPTLELSDIKKANVCANKVQKYLSSTETKDYAQKIIKHQEKITNSLREIINTIQNLQKIGSLY